MTGAVDLLYTLEFSRYFDAPAERVFDAWLGSEWGEWLPPGGARCNVTEIEPKVGGSYHLDMTMSDGRRIAVTGIYRTIVRPEILVFSWNIEYETVITVNFRREGTGTRMNFRQEGIRSIDHHDGYTTGWTGPNGSFAKLDAYLAQHSRQGSHAARAAIERRRRR